MQERQLERRTCDGRWCRLQLSVPERRMMTREGSSTDETITVLFRLSCDVARRYRYCCLFVSYSRMWSDSKSSRRNDLSLWGGNVDNMFWHSCRRSADQTRNSSSSIWTGRFNTVDNRVQWQLIQFPRLCTVTSGRVRLRAVRWWKRFHVVMTFRIRGQVVNSVLWWL